jgi:hypothetical protein
LETLEDQIVEKAGRILGYFFTIAFILAFLKVFLYFAKVGLQVLS